jgi:hypothetical protein
MDTKVTICLVSEAKGLVRENLEIWKIQPISSVFFGQFLKNTVFGPLNALYSSILSFDELGKFSK